MQKMFGAIIEFLSNIYKTLKDKGNNTLSFLVLLIACVITTVYLQNNFEERIYSEIEQTILKIEDVKKEEHKQGFNASMEKYYNIKSVLKDYRKKIGCEYILFLEYHNGAENIATGYQFCKFDITLSICNDTVSPIYPENYRDESIFSYDIFADKEIANNRLSEFTMDQLKRIDRHFYSQLVGATDMEIGKVCTSHIKHESYRAGALIFIFSKNNMQNINKLEIANCASQIEELLK